MRRIKILIAHGNPRAESEEIGAIFRRQVVQAFNVARGPPGDDGPPAVGCAVAMEKGNLRISWMLTTCPSNEKVGEAFSRQVRRQPRGGRLRSGASPTLKRSGGDGHFVGVDKTARVI